MPPLEFLLHFKFPHFPPDCSLDCMPTVCCHQNEAEGKVCVCIFNVYFFLFPLPVCQILPKGVVSVIGPASSPASGSTVSHICGEKEVSVEDKHTQTHKYVQICESHVCVQTSRTSSSMTYYSSFPQSRHDECI